MLGRHLVRAVPEIPLRSKILAAKNCFVATFTTAPMIGSAVLLLECAFLKTGGNPPLPSKKNSSSRICHLQPPMSLPAWAVVENGIFHRECLYRLLIGVGCINSVINIIKCKYAG